MRRVSSRQNPAVRELRALARTPDPGGRRLLLDGAHLVRDAWRARLRFELAAVAASRLDETTEERDLARRLDAAGVDVLLVDDDVLEAMSPATTPSGIVAVALREPLSIEAVLSREGLLVMPVDVQDPGNLGAIVRAAEAGGAAGALVCASERGSTTNPFSWKALRGSMGSALRLPIAWPLDAGAAADALHRARARLIAAVPRGGVDPDAVDWSGRVALVLGGEGPGLPRELVTRCDERVTIPMAAEVESLNVAVAAGILIYAGRRRQ